MPDKFEREIDEILKKIDDFPRRPIPLRRRGSFARRAAGLQRHLALYLVRITASQIMLAAMGVLLFSYLFRHLFPSLWEYGLALGLIMFFSAFILAVVSGGGSGPDEPYFRGRPRSYWAQTGQGVGDRIRGWWRRQRRGP